MPQYYAQVWERSEAGIFSRVTVPIGGSLDALGIPTKDGGPAWTGSVGVSGAGVTSADATGGVFLTDAAPTGKKLVITDVVISTDTAMLVTLREETSARVLARFYLPANGTIQYTPRTPDKLLVALKRLQLVASVSGNVAATAKYYSED